MDMLKKVKWELVVSSVICVALGLILIIFPNDINVMITYILSAFMFLISAVSFYNYFNKNTKYDFYRNDLVLAVATLVLGIIILAKKDFIISIIPLILGVFIIVSGVKKLQNAFDMMRIGIEGWLPILILAAINIVFGIILVVNAFEAAKMVTILIGVGLVYSGLTDMFSTLWVPNRAKKCDSFDDGLTEIDDTQK